MFYIIRFCCFILIFFFLLFAGVSTYYERPPAAEYDDATDNDKKYIVEYYSPVGIFFYCIRVVNFITSYSSPSAYNNI